MSVENVSAIRIGTIVNTITASVYEEPSVDSEVVSRLRCLSSVYVDPSLSTDEFYSIFTESSIEGFCQKKYVALKTDI